MALEKPSVIRLRDEFIDTLRQYMAKGKAMCYTDETCVCKSLSVSRSWNDGDLRARFDQPTGKSGRIIIARVGSRETDWFAEYGLSFIGKNITGDYRKKINGSFWLE